VSQKVRPVAREKVQFVVKEVIVAMGVAAQEDRRKSVRVCIL